MFAVVASVGAVFVFKLAGRVGPLFQIVGIGLFAFTLLSYLLTALKNPGLGPIGSVEEPLLGEPYCRICREYQPLSAVHCEICQVCVAARDHHCPWIGKCVGEQNYYSFICFIGGLVVFIFYVLACSALMGAVHRTSAQP